MPTDLVAADPWGVHQDRFDADLHTAYESLFSLGNGFMGGRGNHEETYSGASLHGNYIGGVYYPDPTRVGWWKNGYPDYFAKVLNAPDWKRLSIAIDGVEVDLASAEVLDYDRRIDFRTGELQRTYRVQLANGAIVDAEVVRFVSMTHRHLGALRYRFSVTAGDGGSQSFAVQVSAIVDGNVHNQDANEPGGFWERVDERTDGTRSTVVTRTKKSGFVVSTAADVSVVVDGAAVEPGAGARRAQVTSVPFEFTVAAGSPIETTTFGSVVTTREHPNLEVDELVSIGHQQLDTGLSVGFDALRSEHHAAWQQRWNTCDVVIDGDPAVQQGIRFGLFGLNSTFTGEDPDLNIGPKGFTGEKYGGVTYWDTEAFCLPFYLATAPTEVVRNLLRYRHRQLDRAIENAEKLGFTDGAALYPMVTINGEECHNEWEITFEEIHRNGAIAFAVHDYVRYTGDERYLLDGGIDVLVGIARFWAQRVSWSEPKQAWVILGVTGPNEYENNVNNNWYTNTMAQWSLRYAGTAIDIALGLDTAAAETVVAGLGVDSAERARWDEIADNLFLPEDRELGIVLQQEGYLDKEQLTAADLDPSERPINQHWSWDRILRSPFIKQADVLQGMWVLEDRFDRDVLERNFDYYEPRTVHESSLSPSIHAVLAARLGRLDQANQLLRRTARLDLDDINAEVAEGCHTTSMAGTWIAAVIGFGGLRVMDGVLHLDPQLAPGWTRLEFQVHFRDRWLRVECDAGQVVVTNTSEHDVQCVVAGNTVEVPAGGSITR